MDATEILKDLAEALYHAELEAVMIGNAAAALQGAPVTTMDIDFCVRDTEDVADKVRQVAEELAGEFLDFYPFYQVQVPERQIYVKFLCSLTGIDSFGDLMARSIEFRPDGLYTLHIACLEDIIASKTAAGDQKDLSVLPILKSTLELKHEG